MGLAFTLGYTRFWQEKDEYECKVSPVEESRVKVYLFNFNKFNEPNNVDYVSAVYRETDRDDLKDFVVEQIILGPDEDELDLGLKPTFGQNNSIWFTSPSDCEGKDFILSVENGLATVQFCRDTSLAGDMSGFIVEQQVGESLKEFSEVDRVLILDSQGRCFNDMKGDTDLSNCYYE